MIEIDRLSMRFAGHPEPALRELQAALPAGRFIGVVGPDGAGKTTLLRLMIGLLRPDDGSIRVDGHDSVQDAERIRQFAGYMPQRFGLYEDLSVAQNMALFADLRGVTGAERGRRFAELLEFTGLAEFGERLAGALSGGMKQKLGLACALLQRPRLLLLDEPSVGVDPISRLELWRMVAALVDDGVSVLWATAYLDEAERCDTVLLLNQGRLLFQGPPAQLHARVEGRTFTVRTAERQRRSVLGWLLEQDGVLDATLAGRRIRLLLERPRVAEQLQEASRAAGATEELKLLPVVARFEDGFIDMLGGGPGGGSALADRLEAIEDDRRPVIEASGLCKRFGDFTAVHDASFSIGRGEVFGLLGPNGAGKSTIFKMLCGLLPASAGTATVAGLDLRVAAAKARQSLGYMAQRFSLYGGLSVAQNLDFFSGVYGLRGRARRREVERMLTIFALEDYAQEAAENLPLGYKQRLALACALMHQPQVLFLDEPTSGVDPVTRREFWNHINGMVRKGLSIMVSTHFMDEAEYCDRIALIDRGRVIAAGSPDDLKQQASRLRGGAADDEEIDLETAFIALLQASGQRTADDANSTNGRTNGTHTSDSANIASKRTHGS